MRDSEQFWKKIEFSHSIFSNSFSHNSLDELNEWMDDEKKRQINMNKNFVCIYSKIQIEEINSGWPIFNRWILIFSLFILALFFIATMGIFSIIFFFLLSLTKIDKWKRMGKNIDNQALKCQMKNQWEWNRNPHPNLLSNINIFFRI